MSQASDRRQQQNMIDPERRKSERRESLRAAVDMWVEETRGNELYFRRSSNLSMGGLYFEQSLPHTVGTKVELKFTVPGHDEVIETSAKVVNTSEDKQSLGMGLRFIEMNETHRAMLRRFIEKKTRTA